MPALDHFMMSRYFAYQAIVFHRAACCFDVLARALYMSLLHYNQDLPQNADQLRGMARGDFDGVTLLEWNDHLYWQRLQDMSRLPNLDAVTKELLIWLFERKQPKVVREERVGFGVLDMEADGELAAYEVRCADIKDALPAVLAETGTDPRLCFFHESSKPVYDDPVLEWDEADGPPDSDSVLVERRGHLVAGPLETVPHSLMRQAARLNFKYFRVYAPYDKHEGVRDGLAQRLGA